MTKSRAILKQQLLFLSVYLSLCVVTGFVFWVKYCLTHHFNYDFHVIFGLMPSLSNLQGNWIL